MVTVILLAAAPGAGKTSACQRTLALAREAGMRVGGVLAPAYDAPEGHKQGIEAQDVLTGEYRLLAQLVPQARATVGRYRFDPEALAWALERVQLALRAPIDLVLIDEIGPLELERNAGLAPALVELPQAEACVALLCVRAELLSRLEERLRPLAPRVVMLTLANRDQLPERLCEEIWGPVAQRWAANTASSLWTR